jgi:hypothetical protein
MLAEEWQAAHRIQAHELVSAFLKKGSVLELDAGALGRGDVYTV